MKKIREIYSSISKHANKRNIQGGALILVSAILVVGAVYSFASTSVDEETTVDIQVEPARTAGIISTVTEMEANAEEAAVAYIESADVTVVAATTDQVEEDPEDEYDEWNDKVMAEVKEYLSIRSEATKESEVIGKLRAGDVATLIDVFDGWYEIESGNAHGFVSADYCVTGIDAYMLALDVCNTYATTTTSGLRLRTEPTQDSKIIKTVPIATKLIVDNDVEAVDGWVAVSSAGKSGYVSAEYVEVEMETGTAITIEEEREAKRQAEEAAKKAKEAAAAAAAQNQAVLDSAGEQVLLAAIIQIEAGHECYEGKVSVGSVVMNRVRSGSYPNSIYGVIYARGQFATGRMVSVISNGPNATCMQAAWEAMCGVDYTGGATHFRRAGSVNGLVIGNHVFY